MIYGISYDPGTTRRRLLRTARRRIPFPVVHRVMGVFLAVKPQAVFCPIPLVKDCISINIYVNNP